MKKSFAVIGLGRFGSNLAQTLFDMGQEVLALDVDADRVEEVKDRVTLAVQADMRDERVLSRLEIGNFDVVVIAIGGDVQSSILATVLCKELGAKEILAKAGDPLHAKLLRKVGADKVLLTEREAGERLARSLVSSSLIDYLEISDRYSVSEVTLPKSWEGRTLMDLAVRNRFDVSVIAIRRGEDIVMRIDPKEPLQPGDVMIIIGENDHIQDVANVK